MDEPAGSIGSGVFGGCEYLRAITLPIESIKGGVCGCMDNDAGLNAVVGWGAYTCKTAVSWCRGNYATTLKAHCPKTCGGCLHIVPLENVTLTASATAAELADGAFAGCTSLQTVVFPRRVTRIGSTAFAGTNLTSIELPDTIKSIGRGAFHGTRLVDISFPPGLSVVEAGAFKSCTSLRSASFTVPTDPSSASLAIRRHAFSGCTSLRALDLPGHTSSIGDSAFEGCASLSELTLPCESRLANIGMYAFRNTNFTDLVVPRGTGSLSDAATLVAIQAYAFASSNFILVGQGFCCESNCEECDGTLGAKSTCVNSLDECEEQCATTPDCRGIAFSMSPPAGIGHTDDAQVECATSNSAR